MNDTAISGLIVEYPASQLAVASLFIAANADNNSNPSNDIDNKYMQTPWWESFDVSMDRLLQLTDVVLRVFENG